MKFFRFIIIFFLGIATGQCQYSFNGHISDSTGNKTVYLSLIEDYRKISRTYLEQIIRKTKTDSTGFFGFHGDNLFAENRIYKIHIDECSEKNGGDHFFGNCDNGKSVLFIANVKDTIYFPTTFNDEVFCDLTSTNPNSRALLDINILKEDMIYEFTDFRSEVSRNLNSKEWFKKFQEYGLSLNEPLAELYIYEFLSDRRNEIYDHYLLDIGKNPYYGQLLERLKANYPNAKFTQLYESDIHADKQLVNQDKPNSLSWIWILSILLFLSIITNAYLISSKNKLVRNQQLNRLQELTQQEQKIASLINQNKTNKEIATELFISVSTVKTHINNLYKKLQVSARNEIKELFP